ncbi:MAG: hypothetical protein DU430_04730 [Candidatus Tokpelaia sp.]|nr:MAG: hypothetical protein DU430_04730 [Candidatus Tokpelaia sp.]
MIKQLISAKRKFIIAAAMLPAALLVGAACNPAAWAQGQRNIAAPEHEAQAAGSGAENSDGDFPPPPPGAASGAGFPPAADSGAAQPAAAGTGSTLPAAEAAGAGAAMEQSGQQMPDHALAGGKPPLSATEQSLAIQALQQQMELLTNRVKALELLQAKMPAAAGGADNQAVVLMPPPAAARAHDDNDEESYIVPAEIGADALYQSGQDFMAQGQYAKAASVWRAFDKRFADDERAAAAAFELGECYFARGLYAKSAEIYLNVQAKYKTAPVAPRSLLQLALSMANLQDSQTACAALEQLAKQYPQADPAVLQQGKQTGARLQCR